MQHRRLIGVLALLGAVAAILLFALSERAGRQRPSLPGPISMFESERELLANPAGALDIFRSLGVDVVRVYVQWISIAPSPYARRKPIGFRAADPASYPARNWEIYDTIVREAHARGLTVDFTLGGAAPLWATGPGAPRGASPLHWRPSAHEFGLFVRAFGIRYSGGYDPIRRSLSPGTPSDLPRVGFWSIWNEPNYGPDLAPQAIDYSTVEVSPRLYRQLLDAAWAALHASGHGRDTILIGELAPRGLTLGDNPGNFSGMVPLRFIRALYCVDSSYSPLQGSAATKRGCPTGAAASRQFPNRHPALFHASGFAIHPYPQGQAPDVRTPAEPDYADLPSLPTLESVLDRLQRLYGSSTRFPIYSTEYGYQTSPPGTTPVSPDKAAYYLNWSEYLTWRQPRLRSYDQFLLADPTSGNFATGLEFADGTPKPALDAYRLPLYLPATAGRAGQQLEVWGCVRPSDYARRETHRRQEVLIQFRPDSATRFRTIRRVPITNRRGYFDIEQVFEQSGSVRLAWSYPDGQSVYSRLQHIALR